MSEEEIIEEKLDNLEINDCHSEVKKDNENNQGGENNENNGIKSILLRNINILESVLNDNDSFDDLVISYLIKDENKMINKDFDFSNLWLLISKICESWNTKDLLGFDTPITKEELKSLFEDIWKTNNNEIEENDIDDLLKVLDIYEIKPIILIIFENIILGYKKIIENF